MKIGILTITPNVGFGGILQAYALKNVLDRVTGGNTEVINYKYKPSFKSKLSFLVHFLSSICRGNFSKLTFDGDYYYRSKNVRPFHDKFLNFSNMVSSSRDLIRLINESYDAVVVGSDQVWRPKYVLGIENYFFQGIRPEISKIAYAASFGVYEWEFSNEETNKCSELICEFKYVSVREESGVALVKNKLDYTGNVYCDLDPTLLAGKVTFEKFLSKPKDYDNYIFTYILDGNGSKSYIVTQIKDIFKLNIFNFNTSAENFSKPLKERVAPRVEDWLSGIFYSSFVVTDSFHGCVFSILFNKPFFVYVNKRRGAERFNSILGLLGLKDRMIYNQDEFNENILKNDIDWDLINTILATKRNEIIQRLTKLLNNII